MGTDIHLRLQVREGEQWVDRPVAEYARSRQYAVFSFLAGVRNGLSAWPQGALPTGHQIIPAFPYRDLPDGMDPDEVHPWLGDHSFTWATVAELKALDWEVEVEFHGLVDSLTYSEWRESGDKCPKGWCGGTSGHVVSEELLKEPDAIRKLAREHRDWCVHARWTWPAVANSDFRRWLDTLTRESLGVPLDEARVLMGFDS